MNLLRLKKSTTTQRRGDTVIEVLFAGRRVALSPGRQHGFTLIELVITLTVMTILTLGVIPLVKVSVKRQKEQQLREALRQMREAIDQFHREAVRSPCTGQVGTQTPGTPPPPQPQPILDPRIKVVISDCTIFGVDNPDRYPPDLETLVSGVDVIPYGAGLGQRGNLNVNALDAARSDALAAKKKIYLRAIPVNPITGEKDWDLRSCYDDPEASSWGGENVFDVRFPKSKARMKALNGEDYSDW